MKLSRAVLAVKEGNAYLQLSVLTAVKNSKENPLN